VHFLRILALWLPGTHRLISATTINWLDFKFIDWVFFINCGVIDKLLTKHKYATMFDWSSVMVKFDNWLTVTRTLHPNWTENSLSRTLSNHEHYCQCKVHGRFSRLLSVNQSLLWQWVVWLADSSYFQWTFTWTSSWVSQCAQKWQYYIRLRCNRHSGSLYKNNQQ